MASNTFILVIYHDFASTSCINHIYFSILLLCFRCLAAWRSTPADLPLCRVRGVLLHLCVQTDRCLTDDRLKDAEEGPLVEHISVMISGILRSTGNNNMMDFFFKTFHAMDEYNTIQKYSLHAIEMASNILSHWQEATCLPITRTQHNCCPVYVGQKNLDLNNLFWNRPV